MSQTKQDGNPNSRGSLLKEMEADSDSELVPEFSLPPKSVVKRPKKNIKKRTRSTWSKFCRRFCRHCSGVVLAIVLCACLLSTGLLFWFSLRLYRDVQNLSRRLTIEINRVQAEQIENIEKCNALKKNMEENVQKSHVWQRDVDTLKHNLFLSFSKIAFMNRTLFKISRDLHDANSKVMLNTKVDALQKGMADTGAEITKLSDEVKQMEKKSALQSLTINRINTGLWNISFELANLTGKSEPTFPPMKYPLEAFDDDTNPETTERGKLEKSALLSGDETKNVVEMASAINQSLFSKVRELQSQTQELKMKLNGIGFARDNLDLPTPIGNISKVVEVVRKDVSSLQYLLTRLNYRVRNLTRNNIYSSDVQHVLTRKVSMNMNEIKLLWDELILQNKTLFDIRHSMDMDVQHKPEVSLSQQQPHGEPETTQSTENVVSFRMFPKPEDHDATIDKRRDVLESDYESERRNSKPNSESKRSDTYHDVMHDNEYLD